MKHLKILIVDDDPDISAYLKTLLSFKAPNFLFSAVPCAEECLEYLKRYETDCILCDYQMPGMDGMELLVELRGSGSDTPFIFITGQGNEEVACEAFKNGASDYFTKDAGFAHYPRLINSIHQSVARTQAERAKREAENMLALLKEGIESLPIGITISDTEGRIIYTNPAEAKIHGYERNELVGRVARSLGPSNNWQPVKFDRLRKLGAWRRESVNIKKSGEAFPVNLTSIPVNDADGKPIGIVTACEDATEINHAREELLKFRFIVDWADEEVYLINRYGIVAYANEAAAVSLGYRKDEMTGLRINKVDELFARHLAKVFGKAREKAMPTFQAVHSCKDGSSVTRAVRANYLKVGECECVCCFAHPLREENGQPGSGAGRLPLLSEALR